MMYLFSYKWIKHRYCFNKRCLITSILIIILCTAVFLCIPGRLDDRNAINNVAPSDELNVVKAENYKAFWLWTGVKNQPILNDATTIYIHQGEFNQLNNHKVSLVKQGITSRKITRANEEVAIWLTFRVNSLVDHKTLVNQMNIMLTDWKNAGTHITGIQLDFDAASYKLDNYAIFLKQVREILPKNYQLSITGLLDWAKTGDINVLNRLGSDVDEIVIQTYQGIKTVDSYASYLPVLLKLKIPFRVGLVQHGTWDNQWELKLAQSPFYLGEVIFLVN